MRLFGQIFLIALSFLVFGIAGGVAVSLGLSHAVCVLAGVNGDSFFYQLFFLTLNWNILICGFLGAVAVAPRGPKAPRVRSIVAVTGLLCCLLSATIFTNLRSPQFYLLVSQRRSHHDDESGPICEARLAAMGPRAIGPLVAEIGEGSGPELRNALKKLGKPAHEQLIESIDREPVGFRKLRKIIVLQQAFGDFSKLPLSLHYLKRYPGLEYELLNTLRGKLFEEVPRILKEPNQKQFNPAFVKWYQGKTGPKGPFGSWNPKKG